MSSSSSSSSSPLPFQRQTTYTSVPTTDDLPAKYSDPVLVQTPSNSNTNTNAEYQPLPPNVPINIPPPNLNTNSNKPFASSSASASQYYPRNPQQFGTFWRGQQLNEPTTPISPVYPPFTLTRRPTVMVTKEVTLSDSGEFIIDIPLTNDYTSKVAHSNAEEFTHLRYTACTATADDFADVYTLRQNQLDRKTRIAVVCTMYNEDDQLFTKTLSAVMDNIAYLCSLKKHRKWNKDSWKEIVVCIVSDGRTQCNPKTLDVLSASGLFMNGLPRSHVNGKDVKAHMFEFTTQVRIPSSLEPEFSGTNEKIVPVQSIFLLKEKNAKKINSHRWFFNGVCKLLNPEVCILIDVGTKPTRESFYHLYRAFDRNDNVAGACGEIAAELGPYWKNLINPLVAVQNFEYKMSNILDKPLESVFGYISVLPGAFSAYRYAALKGRPLETYFKGEALHSDSHSDRPDVSQSNMYLAEDRILCFELVMKREKRYVLKYVKSAKAETDVPTEFHDLIKQRRRWFNGSFFASVYAVTNFGRIFTSGHTIVRKLALLVETLYNAVNLVYSWFNISSIYCCFFFMFNIASAEMADCSRATVSEKGKDIFYPYGGAVSAVLRGVYIGAFLTMVIASLGNKPETIKPLLAIIAIIFAICMCFMLTLIVWTIYLDIKGIPSTVHTFIDWFNYMKTDENFFSLTVSLLCTYVVYLVSSIMYFDPWHTFTCMLQYLLLMPSFSNMLMVYAFCNIHDISWGTKGQDQTSSAPAVMTTLNKKGKQVTTTDVPAPDYANELIKLQEMAYEVKNPHAVVEKAAPRKSSEDHFKSYRTYVLMWWFLSNFALTYILTNEYIIRAMAVTGKPHPFLVFLLWSVAGLTSVRFLGSLVYWVQWVMDRAVDW